MLNNPFTDFTTFNPMYQKRSTTLNVAGSGWFLIRLSNRSLPDPFLHLFCANFFSHKEIFNTSCPKLKVKHQCIFMHKRLHIASIFVTSYPDTEPDLVPNIRPQKSGSDRIRNSGTKTAVPYCTVQ
jgi:hypothetical protein